MPDRVVYVVAKAPRLGAVKTRLCPPLTLEQATDLYRAFLMDSLELAWEVPDAETRTICPDPSQAAELLPLIPPGCGLVVQAQPGLSSALESCFRDGLANGHRAVAVIASDNPTLPSALISRAFSLLERKKVVIGPAEDGGYYLIASRGVHATLFRDMIWSTPTVLDETLRRCELASLSVGLLPVWHDVDTPAALDQLMGELAGLQPERARHTRAALQAAWTVRPGLDPIDEVEVAATGAGAAHPLPRAASERHL